MLPALVPVTVILQLPLGERAHVVDENVPPPAPPMRYQEIPSPLTDPEKPLRVAVQVDADPEATGDGMHVRARLVLALTVRVAVAVLGRCVVSPP
jgi:hypothetical protein